MAQEDPTDFVAKLVTAAAVVSALAWGFFVGQQILLSVAVAFLFVVVYVGWRLLRSDPQSGGSDML